MYTAMDINKNQIVTIDEGLDTPSNQFICPICEGDVIIKNGSINVPHFAHRVYQNCDMFTEDMSDWHRSWQELFPKKTREMVIELKTSWEYFDECADEKNFVPNFPSSAITPTPTSKSTNPLLTLKHRADICLNGYVVEFQHSPLSREEFNARNWFYHECGYKVVWVFDMQEKYINYYDSTGDIDKYKWLYANKTCYDFYASRSDLKKNYFLFFQLTDDFLCRVTWARPKDIYDEFGDYLDTYNDFSRFCTNSRYDLSIEEFVAKIKQKK